MAKTRWICAAVWLWICAAGMPLSAAAKAHFSVRVWNTEDGLPQNVVLAMRQTLDGYLWLGTLNGLARFDGLHFTTFNEGNTPGLDSSRIVKLFEDSHGQLWIGTETAGVFLVKDGVVKSVDLGRSARGEGRVMSICEDVNGAIWLYTMNGQLCRYQNGKGDVWNAGSGSPSPWRWLVADGNLVWVGSRHSLVALGPVPAGAAAGLPVAYGPEETPVRRLDFLLPSRRGGYWRLADGRIQKWHGNRRELDLTAYPWSANTPVSAACEDLEGNLVVGTYGDGVYWFDAHGNSAHLAAELSHNSILSLVVDREGCLWVGTNGGGLDRVKRQVFEVLPGSQGSTVQSVCADGQGGLWIGYNGERIDHWHAGQLRHYTSVLGAVSLYAPEVPGAARWYAKSMFVDHAQQVWAGTFVGGLYELQGDQFKQVPGTPAAVTDVSAIFEDHSHNLWVGTEGGLAQWNGTEWRSYTTRDGLSADAVRAMAEDRHGGLWVGTEGGGLDRLRDGRWSCYGRTNGLPSNNVLCLYVDSDGVLWVGTSSGLARFKDGQWTSFSNHGHLASGSIGYLLEDEEGYLWIGTYAGLVRVSKKELNDMAAGSSESVVLRTYGESDGLPSSECSQGSQPAACRTRDGTLWFPTIKGLVSVKPALLHPNTNPPPVLIESVQVDGQAVGTNSLRAPPLRSIVVPPGKESLEITYTSLNLDAADKGLFRYRLKGHETGWTERPGDIRYVHYSKLPPGNYHFCVQACNQDGYWNRTGATLAVTVLPPFWLTWWFLAASTLTLLGLVIGAVHYVSTQKLTRQLAVLRQQEALEKERARIARDLHDQLGANLTQVALLGELAESDKDLPVEVEDHARQISQTARDTTRALDEIVWTVNPSNDTLDGLINYLCKYAQEYLALAGLRYRLEVPSPLPPLPISPELRHNVFLAAKEAINNVVKHSHASAAWLRLQLEPDRFILAIEDNGRGLAPGDENRGRNGLRNMRKRLEEVGGQFELSPGAEGGTKVRLTVPLHKAPNHQPT